MKFYDVQLKTKPITSMFTLFAHNIIEVIITSTKSSYLKVFYWSILATMKSKNI